MTKVLGGLLILVILDTSTFLLQKSHLKSLINSPDMYLLNESLSVLEFLTYKVIE